MNTAKKKPTRAGRYNPKQVRILLVGASLAAVAAMGIGLYCSSRYFSDAAAAAMAVSTSNAITYDTSAVSGGWDSLSEEEIIASLNEKLEAGMINISMNTAPVFASGTAAGNLMIVNESVNNYPQIVEISRNDTGEIIYTSGAIPVGSKIEQAALDMPLPAGTYDCTAMFHSVDPDTGDIIGSAGAVITVTIQS
jgi:hypothetical protein